MYDRALQALVKQALEPEWEARFEPNSYGFRPGRSCHDAIEAIFTAIKTSAKYVLDADIAKCFDRIDHKALLEKLNTFPTLCRQVRAWLKAGVMDGGQLFPTSEGTPQGGVISPLLANIALHGLEKEVMETVRKGKTAQKGLTLVRYADDFVVFHKDIAVVQRCQQKISEWLKGIGLELKPSKTRLAHTLNRYGEEDAGFDFLGFTVRQFPVGKYQSGKNSNGNPLCFKTLIKPSQKKIKLHTEKLSVIVRNHRGATQEALISHINPIIRGWANFYSTVVSKEIFSDIDNIIYHQLTAWARFRHPNKNAHWAINRYWLINQGGGWVFASRKEGTRKMHLKSHSETPIIRHTKVQGRSSPYDGDFVYWSIRMGRHPEVGNKTATLLKRQKGKCTHCGLFFKNEDLLEIDHINPKAKGGKDNYDNLQLLHRHCHDTKTADDKTAVKAPRVRLGIKSPNRLSPMGNRGMHDKAPSQPRSRVK